eukprot:1822200-Pyramimonas_sp.AAC.1
MSGEDASYGLGKGYTAHQIAKSSAPTEEAAPRPRLRWKGRMQKEPPLLVVRNIEKSSVDANV